MTQESDYTTEPSSLSIILKIVLATIVISAFIGVLLAFSWNQIVPQISHYRISPLEYWQGMLVIFVYNIVSLSSIRSILQISNYSAPVIETSGCTCE